MDSTTTAIAGLAIGSFTCPCPILSLPNEITAEIFTQMLPPYPDAPPISGPASPECLLLGICRHWRVLALHTPSLWRAIELGHTPRPNPERVRRVQEWLERSGDCRLSLQVNLATTSKINDKLFQVLLEHRSRWEYVSLALRPGLVPLVSGPAPALVRIKLTADMGRTRQPPLRLEAAERLRFCSLWNVPHDSSSVRWEQLTTLAIYNEAPANAASILPLAANLRCCALLLSANSSHDGIAILHPRIETLVLLHYGWQDLHAFTLPALRYLELSGFSFPSDTTDSISAFVARSRCALSHLRLVCNDAVPWQLVDTCRSAVPDTSVVTVRREDHRQDEDGWNTDEYWTER